MKSFSVVGKVFRPGKEAWHFVYVSKALSQRIRDRARSMKGVNMAFIRVKAKIGKTSWTTSLFPTKDGPYLIAIKADVRHKESIAEGDTVKIICKLL
ncbi:hypothetical protein A2765_05825 [Candidatus Kaiserbacteria bacterium RIFCSPHIGHO2_01_FULL_56_24]|uniref:DUF1905 domain-containing protein n=1 Tax=Candidatus Kaiserbacteria bacterium RIFCSPHIGHO2_01_FULL_56_24 TaxID=1798487 RepID=A0A1F6DAT9_9BACT|nr:MAG: hypothetical protein A2765_05825 [Candidatus Kaiserbacteria bacterium RIFCSPHIGHO2_01_FULL_56_24]